MYKMKSVLWAAIAGIAIASFISVSSAYLIDDNPYRHFVSLDKDEKYQLEWLVDWENKEVIFNVTVATKGYVGFGLSKKGKMEGADIVIGGVSNGKPYFSDMHGVGNKVPIVDKSQDWTLLHASETHSKTVLCFKRAFDTCDDEDLPITDDVISIIWAYSEVDDELQYHFHHRGTYEVYLLDPDLVPRDIDPNLKPKYWQKNSKSDMNVYKVTQTVDLPAQDTLYYCSFHKVPTKSKQHIIGWNTVFPTERDRSFVHHLLLHRCRAPEGVSAYDLFEGPARSKGTDCYFVAADNALPTNYCRETIHVWGVNGRAIFFPDHVGVPMSESGTEYFLLQVHYDNPNLIRDEKVEVSINAYYTDNIRENDAGLLQLGEQLPGAPSILIGPSSLNHTIIGHCGSGCTDLILPSEGINVFGVFMHTHLAGRAVISMHLRESKKGGYKELPWILADENYNFNFQNFRILRQERRVLQDDAIMNKCIYDTSDRNGSVVVGGFSTREEMCTSLMYYYPRMERHGACRSEIRSRDYWNLLGIQNVTWDQSIRKMVITAPPQFYGMTVADYANNYIKWDLETREAIQRHHIYTPQVTTCPRVDTPPATEYDDDEDEDDAYGASGTGHHGSLGYTKRRLLRYSPEERHSSIQVESDKGNRYTGGWTQPEEDEGAIGFQSIYPKGIPRYRRPAKCVTDSSYYPWLTEASIPKKKSLSMQSY